MKTHRRRAAFSLVEFLAIVACIAVVYLVIAPSIHTERPASRIKCVHNLKNVGLAFRIFATDHGDLFPAAVMLTNGIAPGSIDALSVYLTLSSELSTPKIVYCRADKKRVAAESFTNLTTKNISYFASFDAAETDTEAFLAGDRNIQTNGVLVPTGPLVVSTNIALSWSKEIHNEQGDIAMGDGSVRQLSSARLKYAVGDQQLETNRLVFP